MCIQTHKTHTNINTCTQNLLYKAHVRYTYAHASFQLVPVTHTHEGMRIYFLYVQFIMYPAAGFRMLRPLQHLNDRVNHREKIGVTDGLV